MTCEGCGPVIGKLRGIIDSYGEDFVILDVQGVGYVVHCSSRTLQHLPSTGEAATRLSPGARSLRTAILTASGPTETPTRRSGDY